MILSNHVLQLLVHLRLQGSHLALPVRLTGLHRMMLLLQRSQVLLFLLLHQSAHFTQFSHFRSQDGHLFFPVCLS